jgi:hypothetical protein
MADVSTLTYPKKSHRKAITIPEHSVELAEFFGIMMGDGEIGSEWQARISLNSVADLDHSSFVVSLGESLFGIVPVVRKRKGRFALTITFSSVALVDFLVSEGIPRGDKIRAGLHMPDWVYKNVSYRKAAVRGLMDTDGCLYIHKHKVAGKEYRNLGLCFTSYSAPLIAEVTSIFEENQIMPHISGQGRNIFLYKKEAVTRYMQIFGSSNERIKSVYRRAGGVG